jgi:Na+:H+ antiporter, NhaA family
MSNHVLTHDAMGLPRLPRSPWTMSRFVHLATDHFHLLPIGALIGIIWVNTAAESYFKFSVRLSFFVNEILMALVFGLITQEIIEAAMPGAVLHSWRRWGMPIILAAGGVVGAATAYIVGISLNHERVLPQAWPIACAIDIAGAYYVLKMILPRGGALPFLLLLAIATDAFGLVVVGVSYPVAQTHTGGTILMLAALGLAMIMRRRKVRSFWPYLAICGTLSWLAFYREGIHPALALVPIVPFLPHERRSIDLFEDPPDDDPTHHFEHEWNYVVQAVLFLFALVNAGVVLKGYGPSTWAILGAALIGRPLGIFVGLGVALYLGLHLPAKVGWRELLVIALATTSGFTFTLFFATGIISIGPALAEVKLGALATTVVGTLLVFAAAWLLRVGRFGASWRRHRMTSSEIS